MRELNYKGTKYPVKGGTFAAITFCQRKGIEFYQFIDRIRSYNFEQMSNDLVLDLAEFAICFIERGTGKTREDLGLNYADVVDWIPGCDISDKRVIIEMIRDSMGIEMKLEEEDPEPTDEQDTKKNSGQPGEK